MDDDLALRIMHGGVAVGVVTVAHGGIGIVRDPVHVGVARVLVHVNPDGHIRMRKIKDVLHMHHEVDVIGIGVDS